MTNTKQNTLSYLDFECFMEWLKNTLKLHCQVKFDVEELQQETSLSEGSCELPVRKVIELFINISEDFNVKVDPSDIKRELINGLTPKSLYKVFLNTRNQMPNDKNPASKQI